MVGTERLVRKGFSAESCKQQSGRLLCAEIWGPMVAREAEGRTDQLGQTESQEVQTFSASPGQVLEVADLLSAAHF